MIEPLQDLINSLLSYAGERLAGVSEGMQLGPVIGDARGMALAEFLLGGGRNGVLEILERDDGFLSVTDMARYFLPIQQWRTTHVWACDQARGRILDLGAGAGTHSLHLQDRGLRVTALDTSPFSIEVCRARGVQETFLGTTSELRERSPEPFDTVMLLGSGVGFLWSREAGKAFLEELSNQLRPSGRVIAEEYSDVRTLDFAVGSMKPVQERLIRSNSKCGQEIGFAKYRYRHLSIATDWFDWIHPEISYALEVFESAGFEVIDAIEEDCLYALVAEKR